MSVITRRTGVITPGEHHMEIRPKYRGPARPGVLFVHGAGGGADYCTVPLGRQSHLTNALIDGIGATGVSHDLGGLYTWGNAVALARMDAAYAHLQTLPGVKPGPVWLVSSSMGAHTSLNWAAQHPEKVAGVISIIPVINPTDIVAHDRMGYGSNPVYGINQAYGGWDELAHGTVYNPQTLACLGRLRDIPMLFWYGTSDALCVPYETQRFAQWPGMDVTLIPIEDGHEMTAYDKPDHQVAVQFVRDNQP